MAVKFREKKDIGPRTNERITASEVRVISSSGKQLGIISIREALNHAEDEGFDLVEVSPDSNPPVCKIIDYGKLRYREQKSKKEAKKIIDDSKKKLDRDIENKKQKFNDEIEKELVVIEKEIKDLKKTSTSSIADIAAETSAEIIRQIINTEINKSNVSAIVNDISKREIEKHI